jgi:hypothetical protein
MAYKELVTFPTGMGSVEEIFKSVVNFHMWKNIIRVFKFQVCERKFFNLLKVSTLKFEKMCEREFFKVLKECGRKVFKLLKVES